MEKVNILKGNSPLVLGFPHVGTWVPDNVFECLNHRGKTLSDTDWHIEKLYEGLLSDVTSVSANFHRYVVDANRDPSGISLYPGQNTTDLVPLTDFDGLGIWKHEPTKKEIDERTKDFHSVYHAALQRELNRIKSIHGFVVLYDCHSIRSVIPHLFKGILPDLNIGTNSGHSCDPVLPDRIENICNQQVDYNYIFNGRFKVGWTTRYYGQPETKVHAIQMEIAQSAYLVYENKDWKFDTKKSKRLRPVLSKILSSLTQAAFKHGVN